MATLATIPPATAADRATTEVSDEKWQEIWADVGYPNTEDKRDCYGRPLQFTRDPNWVIVWYRPKSTPECAGVAGDPYPGLVTKEGERGRTCRSWVPGPVRRPVTWPSPRVHLAESSRTS